MKTNLTRALGLIFLATSLTCVNSFAYSDPLEPALQTLILEENANVSQKLDELICAAFDDDTQTCLPVAQLTEVDQPSSVATAVELGPTDEAEPPVIHSVDAIVVEVTQTVTVAVADEAAEDTAAPAYTGSISPAPAAGEPRMIIDEDATAIDPAD